MCTQGMTIGEPSSFFAGFSSADMLFLPSQGIDAHAAVAAAAALTLFAFSHR